MSIAGYTRTGRVQLGPASDLVEMQSPDGGRTTAIVFHPEYRKHNAINAALGVVLGFLESPMVTGLDDLVAYDLAASTFVYPTGPVWSIAEAVRTLGDLGEVGGVRAGVELMVAVGEILVEAAENGENQGVYSHGGLTPWRIVLDAQGAPQVIGHALPQVEILTFHEQPDRVPREDAFRYCPPERMESKRENFSSDVFSLGLIAFELMTGKPVYDGLVNDIRGKAARGETSRRIHQFREYLPAPVRDLLVKALRTDFRDRFESGAEFLDAARGALDADPNGGRLSDMMERVSQQVSRAREQLDPARTSMLSQSELARLVDEEAGPIAKRPATSIGSSASPRPATSIASSPSPRAPAPSKPPDPPPAPAASKAPDPAPTPTPSISGEGAARRLPPRLREATSEGPPSTPSVAPVAVAPSAVAPADVAPASLGQSSDGRGSLASLPARRTPPRLRDPNAAEPLDAAVAAPAPPPPADAPLTPTMSIAESPAATPTSEAAKWGPPARRPNPRASTSDLAPTPPPAPTPTPAPAAAPAPAARATQPALAGGASATPAVPPPPAVRPQPAGPALPPPPAVLPESARAIPPPPAVTALPPGAADRAADLLRRIRESSGDHTKPRPIAPRAEPPAPATAVVAQNNAAPVAVAPAVVPATAPAVVAKPAPVDPPPAATAPVVSLAPSTPAASSGTTTRPLTSSGSYIPSGVAVSSGSSTRTTGTRARTPDPVRTVLRGESAPYRLCRGPGSAVVQRRLMNGSTLGDIVAVLVGQMVPIRMTADGRLAGWYRLGPSHGPLPPSTRLDTVPADEVLHFHFVPGRMLTLPVEGPAGTVILPVHTALPGASLVDAIASLLNLPPGDWNLTLDGVALDASSILDDREIGPDSRLAVVRA